MNQILNDGPLQLGSDPIKAFQAWYDEAVLAQPQDANAMTLATSTPEGRPDARIVLLKGFGDGGFSFYTNFRSRKGHELDSNPWAALVFFWIPLRRQVRIEGPVERVSDQEADEYFRTRPRGSQVGAWSSPQSQRISGRESLRELVRISEERWKDQSIPRPDFWGGYRVRPERMEFWEERPYRLHERIVFERKEERWILSQIAP